MSIRHNTNGNPDLEFKLNGDLIGVEVMQVMKNMSDGNSKRRRLSIPAWKRLKKNMLAIFGIEVKKDVLEFRAKAFLNRSDDSIKTFNAIRDRIQKTVTQGLKVLFELPEVKKEKFFSDFGWTSQFQICAR